MRVMQPSRSVRDLTISGARAARPRCGFSLIELMAVIGITVVLTALLMPAVISVRGHAERIISASRMRQLGMGMSMYTTDQMNRLPYSAILRAEEPSQLQEMMAIFIGENNRRRFNIPRHADIGIRGFDGLGLLYTLAYIDVAEIFYCPSHPGDHPFERYAQQFDQPEEVIYSNYHYRGDIDVFEPSRPILTLENNHDLVFLTDGMRTRRDLNHRKGFHLLTGDGSVRWRSDLSEQLYQMLPERAMNESDDSTYERLWQHVNKNPDGRGN